MDFCSEYLKLITTEYSGINLTRILDPIEFKEKQYNDSLYPIQKITEVNKLFNDCKNIVDVGFGGGFPILPLAEQFPKKLFFGFEARAKKVKVVSELATKLNLKNVYLYHQRVENIVFDRKAFILIKAVGKIEDLLSRIFPSEDVYVGFYKGPDIYNLENTKIENWELIHTFEYLVDSSLKRTFLIYKNDAVLRGTAENNFTYFSHFN